VHAEDPVEKMLAAPNRPQDVAADPAIPNCDIVLDPAVPVYSSGSYPGGALARGRQLISKRARAFTRLTTWKV